MKLSAFIGLVYATATLNFVTLLEEDLLKFLRSAQGSINEHTELHSKTKIS